MNKTEAYTAEDYRNLKTVGKPRVKAAVVPEKAPAKKKASKPKKAENLAAVARSGREWVLTYSGPAVSLNTLLARASWRERDGVVKKYDRIFSALIHEAQIPPLPYFRVELRYCSKHDPDGCSVMMKFCVDALTHCGIITDDNPTIQRGGLAIEPDFALAPNTFIFTIIEYVAT
ncbi:hypothetical protein [Hymenobacter glacieicola]|uniref:Uncharacterized protein n=1 Tax=Hymenobacter glacieicola TaxID=1562124 RepID=A0ABQ1X873_9BACT|nr:hypothetical protein [Hymenobacter glacieicola]GGG60763.1 hypothetical protein GCM10011378_40990 [Hymenobacter glacieicola]